MTVTIRRVRDVAELEATIAAVSRQFDPPLDRHEHRFHEIVDDFEAHRAFHRCVVDDATGAIVGGVIGVRAGVSVGVRGIGIDAAHRRGGIGAALLRALELEAMAAGAVEVHLGSRHDARGFYERLGYRGKRTMKSKTLPPPGTVRDRLVAAHRAAG
jgi:GNAT superfamily N-acetyltransferase